MNDGYLTLAYSLSVFILTFVVSPAVADSPSASPDGGAQSRPELPNAAALTVKGAYLRFADETQFTHGQEWNVNSRASAFYAFEGEGRLPFLGRRFAIGAEYLVFQTKIARSGAGTGETIVVEHAEGTFLKGKYFFGTPGTFQPYVAFGIGTLSMPDDGNSGPIEGGASGDAIQYLAGLQWRHEWVGLRAEYMYLRATNLKDHGGQDLDLSGHSLILGISIYFGRKS